LSAAGGRWPVAIAIGLGVAVVLIVVPRVTFFEDAAREACGERGAAYSGLDNGPGRYADPVPDGANCLSGDGDVEEVPVDFFADGGFADTSLGWLYRLACVVLPITIALVIGRAGLFRTGW
jgi:hypothetical protein